MTVDAGMGHGMGVKAGLRDEIGGRLAPRHAVPVGFGLLCVTLMSVQTARPLDVWVNLQVALVLLLVGVAASIALGARGHRIQPAPGVVILGAGFVVSALVSTSLSPFPAVATVRLGLYAAVFLGVVALYLGYRRQSSLSLSWWCVTVAVAHVPFSIHALVALGRWSGETTVPDVGVFWNVRHLGTAGMLAAMAAVALVALDPRHRVLGGVLATVGLVDVVATGSRGAFLAWVCTVVLLVALVHRRRVVAAVATLAVTAAFAVVVVLDRTGLLETPNLLDRLDHGVGEGLDAVSSGRVELWSGSLDRVAAYPLLGSGPDAYWLTECCVTTTSHAHNVVLQGLMEFGLVGCMLLAVATLWAAAAVGVRRIAVAATATTQNAVLTAMLAGILALSMIDGAYYWTFPLLHLGAWAGLLAAGVAQALRTGPPGRGIRGYVSSPRENAASRSWEE